jgi:hypothetical protein
MTARQAETILMLSDFLKNAQVVILSIVRIENQRLMSCVKTLCSNLQCLFVLWLKARVPYDFHRTCLLATAMYVMSIMADTKVSKASRLRAILYQRREYLI